MNEDLRHEIEDYGGHKTIDNGARFYAMGPNWSATRAEITNTDDIYGCETDPGFSPTLIRIVVLGLAFLAGLAFGIAICQ